jgi:N-acetylneuraminate synthase
MKIIAELATKHDGSMGLAMAMIKAVADAGAWGVKMQKHDADHESTPDEILPPGPYPFQQDKTRQDYWRRVTFTRQQYAELIEYAHSLDLSFGLSAFCSQAVCDLDVDWWKVPSGEWDNQSMIQAMRRTGKPVHVAWGMGSSCDIFDEEWANDMVFYDCVSEYPTEPERIEVTRGIGFSDHSGTIWPGIIAAREGCPYLEVHVCLHKSQYGFDLDVSLTMEQLRMLVDGVRFVERMGKQPMTPDERKAIHDKYRIGRNCV